MCFIVHRCAVYNYVYAIHINIRVWLNYQPELKLLKELRLKAISENKLKLAEDFKKRTKATTIIQKQWRGYKYVCTNHVHIIISYVYVYLSNIRVWVTYSQRLKNLKEERLRKITDEKVKMLKKLNEAAVVLQKHWRRYKCV